MQKDKEMVYILDCATEAEIIRAEKLQLSLYKKFGSVKVYPTGLCQIKIVATNN